MTIRVRRSYAIILGQMPFERKFYSNVKVLIAANWGVALFIALLPSLAGIRNGTPWIFLGAGIAILGTIILLAARKVWPVHAGPGGLKTYDALGIYSEVPWAEILSANSAFGYYWITTSKGKHLCVPTYLEAKEDFKAYVHRHAPVDNPLRVAL